MYAPLFKEFMVSDDTLQVYKASKLLFSSKQDRLLPLLEYIDKFSTYHRQVVVFDKIMGNAAALLSVEANCQEVYSPLGSQIATETLEKYNIKYHITEIIPYIKRPDGKEMCPMEKLSLDKGPDEFYKVMKDIIK